MNKILIIGTGHMGEAILCSLSKNINRELFQIHILNRNLNKSKILAEKYDCNFIKGLNEINKHNFSIIFLGFKPSDADLILNNINLENEENKIIVSMLNAYSINKIKEHFTKDINILRIMPNMNAKNNCSTTGYAYYGNNKKLIDISISLLNLFGTTYKLEESQFSSFVSLTGSAPAFIYEFIKAFKEFALDNNYKEEVSNEFILKTIVASATEALSGNKNLDDLIKQIIVPGGPTQAGHDKLLNNRFKDILISCFESTKEKA
ncbi:pyrroline-5-carboxylate reductase [Spiroplasma corruscae]|uniref:Pyrroline-5-carboxylate reductase n=1 Tax=Spiroplasma corruscae TaxID=216934 RepID=A0A222EQD4_9MOLU|nr:pyrroline-5-carboxylate reductase dimerization domain-containing protein [Spiroplasma corruscae]ASP28474.1 pyrroline-5-carboxylate reductase [Spiroplasma corruscae]